MSEFEFTLKFVLPDVEANPDRYVEALGAAGCDDALVGVGQSGRIALQFTREANTAFEAVTSAIANVKQAIPGVKLIEATPDLVGLTDVADIIGCSRQYMRKLMITSGPRFPVPVHEGKAALWRLSKVLMWLKDSKQYQVEDRLLEVAHTNMQLNIAREVGEIDLKVHTEIRSLVS